jgi:ABC-type uncharacterized transport system ATPase subunit
VQPTRGALAIGGREVPVGDVTAARAAGIELVHQSFALPPSFTVAEAMEFGADRGRGLFTRRELERRWKRHLESLSVTVSPRERIRDLPVETQQAVEIARALVTDAKVLILDEPTAVLSPSGVEKLFERLKVMQASGVTILLILHKIREVLSIAETVTVLRGGRLIEGPLETRDTDPHHLASAIIGSALESTLSAEDREALVGNAGDGAHAAAAPALAKSAPVLEMRGISTKADPEGPALHDISLSIRPRRDRRHRRGRGQRPEARWSGRSPHLADLDRGHDRPRRQRRDAAAAQRAACRRPQDHSRSSATARA